MKIDIETIKNTKGIGVKTLRAIVQNHNKKNTNKQNINNNGYSIDKEGLYLGDCYTIVPQIKKGIVDFAIIDPPYEISHHGGKKSNFLYKNPNSTKEQIADISNGFDITILDAIENIQDKVNIMVFCSNKQISKIMQWGENRGYITNLLIWHKPDAPPFNNGVYISDVEFIVHIRDYGSVFHKGYSKVFQHNIVRNEGHIASKPIPLLEKHIQNNTDEDDVVLDCFMGSGSTGVACKNLNRKFIGVELDSKIFKTAKKRIENSNKKGGQYGR